MLRTIGRSALVVVAAMIVAVEVAQDSSLVLASQALIAIDMAIEAVIALAAALACALLAAWIVGTERSRAIAARIGAAAFAISSLVALVWTLLYVYEPPIWIWTAIPAIALGVWLCARPPMLEISRRARVAIVAVVLITVVSLGSTTIVDTWDEYRDQRFPEFTIDLVAAYPYDVPPAPGGMRAVVVDPEGRVGDVVELDGERFNLHRGDAMRIGSSDVRRVRWIEGEGHAFVSIRLADRAREAFTERARRRSSQYDAVLVNGEPVMLFFHIMSDERLVLFGPDRAALRRVHAQLTRL